MGAVPCVRNGWNLSTTRHLYRRGVDGWQPVLGVAQFNDLLGGEHLVLEQHSGQPAVA